MNLFEVLHLPSWFPGMSFKKEMAAARRYAKRYLEQPFGHALNKAVMVILIPLFVRLLIS